MGKGLDVPAQVKNDVWAWGLVHDSYGEGEKFRMLTVKDEATSYYMAIEVDRHIRNGCAGDTGQAGRMMLSRHF